MERRRLYFVSVLVVGLMLVAVLPMGFIGNVLAMGQQHNIWGAAEDGPDRGVTTPTTGGNISAWIDGVTYGYNITLGTAEFDLYVDGDWFGLTEEQALKDGGYEGDEIMYFLDYDPTDYYLAISDWTSFFNSSVYENIDLFFDTQTNTDTGTAGDTYLRGLKINEIVLDPADGLTPYVYIWDRNGELDEISIENNYFLQKDDNVAHTTDGPIFDFSANRNDVIQLGTTDYYYINLTGGFTLDAADELKLVWRNPGNTTDDIGNNTDVIVDRVEWGNYINFFDDIPTPIVRDHDNTSLVDCEGTPPVGSGYRRNPNGTDNDQCAIDFDPLPETGRPPDDGPPPTIDSIMITSDDGGQFELLDKSVTPPYSEWGNCSAYNISSGFMGTVSATWTVVMHGINVGTQTVTVWLNASYFDPVKSAWHYDQVMYTVFIGNDVPGSPTDLRVHKGGGAWGGTADDLVLYWKAPISNWDFVTYNIVYYDMDISDGFQYSNWILFERNSSAPGGDDWCELPGWLTDGNNYVFRVNTTNVSKGNYENMIGTNVGYKYGITLTSGISRIWISIPYFSDYDYVSDIAADSGAEFTDGSIITAVERWNYSTQRYDSRLYDLGTWELPSSPDYDIDPGDALFVTVNTASAALPYTWDIVGAYDPTLVFDLLANVGKTSYKMMSLPYHMTYVMASDITAEFPNNDNIDQVGQYNYMTSSWDLRAWNIIVGDWQGEYTIYSPPTNTVMFNVRASVMYPWQPDVMAF
jgi:hypothetical protein